MAGIQYFTVGFEEDIFVIANPSFWGPEGKQTVTEIFKLSKELDKIEPFYLNSDFVASTAALHEGYTMVPSSNGAQILICKLNNYM